VSVLLYRGDAAYTEPQESLERFLAHRRRAEIAALSGVDVELSPTKYRAQGSGATGTYQGYEPISGRRFLAFAIAGRLGVFLFYYEALNTAAEEFASRSRAVLARVELIE